MTNTAATAKCIYQAGQAVEVYVPDFETPGFPSVWRPAVVTSVALRDEKARLWDVRITDERGAFQHQIVGPRGGNKRVRAA